MRLVTGIASVGTAALLPPVVPKAIAIARGARAAHELRRVDVEVTGSVDTYALVVRGTGHGIAAADRGRVFEPFEQLEPSQQKRTPGVGLGLALVRDRVDALGGDIRLESEVGKGTTMHVTRPRVPPSAEDEEQTPKEPQPEGNMAFDEGLAQRIRDHLGKRPDIDEKKMFGGLAFMARGHMAFGIIGDELMVRVGPDAYETALKEPHAREMTFTGRSMRGMVYVGAQGFEDDDDLTKWMKRGLSFTRTLDDKPPPRKRPIPRNRS